MHRFCQRRQAARHHRRICVRPAAPSPSSSESSTATSIVTKPNTATADNEAIVDQNTLYGENSWSIRRCPEWSVTGFEGIAVLMSGAGGGEVAGGSGRSKPVNGGGVADACPFAGKRIFVLQCGHTPVLPAASGPALNALLQVGQGNAVAMQSSGAAAPRIATRDELRQFC